MSENASNDLGGSTPHLDYEQTLMYGKYKDDLSTIAKKEFQRIQSEKLRKAEKQKLTPYTVSRCGKCKRICILTKKYFLQYIAAEWVFLLSLGIIMALLSFAMDYTIEKCQKTHYWLYTELEDYVFLQYLAWVLFPMVFIIFSVGFVHIVSPQAVGSGIPEMKTIMRGVVLHEYLTFKVLVSKMIGLTSSLGSRLPIGKEGPFVHIASIVATLLNKFMTGFTTPFENESRNSEMLAAACAVGVACNFAAPIGGVLFSIEVTATYFAVKNYWRGFFSAVCGALAFRLLAVWNDQEETITALFKTNFRLEFPYDLQELAAFSMIGVVSGFAGAFFVYVHRLIVNFNRNHKAMTAFLQRNRFIYPVVVSIIISSLTYPRGLGQFMAGELTLKEAVDTLFDNQTWSKLGYMDESAVLTGWHHPTVNVYVTLVVFIVVHFFTTAVAITLAVPSGVFMPVFLTGAAFGRLVGEVMSALYPMGFNSGTAVYLIVPGGYAVVGAASLAGAVTHTISTAVIVFELTGQISHILPVMIAVLISNAIAQWLQPSIYESIIQIKELPYLPEVASASSVNKKLYHIHVADFMVKRVQYISMTSTYKNLDDLLIRSKMKTFPLVDSPTSMILIGSVQRNALEHMLDQYITQESAKIRSQAHTANSSSVSATTIPATYQRSHSVGENLVDLVATNNPTDLKEAYTSKPIDFQHCQIDQAPFQLVEHTSLHKVHSLFSLLGLQHAYVTSIGKLVGVVSLKDLRQAIKNASKKKLSTSRDVMYEGGNNCVGIHINKDEDDEDDTFTIDLRNNERSAEE